MIHELMIGNYVLVNGYAHRVYMLDTGGFTFFKINDIFVNHEWQNPVKCEQTFTPISITPKVLSACGFAEVSENRYAHPDSFCKVLITQNGKAYAEIDTITLSDLKGLHHLQNVHWVTSGLPLTIDANMLENAISA